MKKIYKKAGNLFSTAYLLIIFAIYPLFMRQGYADIGKDKYQFFLYFSLATLVILGLIAIDRGMLKFAEYRASGQIYLIDWDRISVTDLFVMMYAVETFISYTFSDYRKEALWGTEGWYMGLMTQLILCALYFLISRMWDGKRTAWYLAVISSGMVCFIGILNRFSIYLSSMDNRPNNFLSTIGNINWFCGYLSVTAPIGICLFLFSQKAVIKCLTGIYTVIVFGVAFVQGADSAFLFMGALFYLLLWIAVTKREWLRDWFLLLALWGFSAQGIRISRIISNTGYNYEANNLCGYLTTSNITLWIVMLGLLVYLYLLYQSNRSKLSKDLTTQVNKEDAKRKAQIKILHKIMGYGLAIGVGCWFLLALGNTLAGIPGLGDKQAFLLNDNWGNGRGATFHAGIWTFSELPLVHKILGAGPDCFSAQAYALPELAAFLRSTFGTSRLTNAHNELLTCLVNNGLIGVMLYIGMFISFLVRCMKKGETQPILYMTAVCIFCYFIHNMVSFAQVLNFPFAILILAMGEKLLTNSGNLPTIRVQSKENETEN